MKAKNGKLIICSQGFRFYESRVFPWAEIRAMFTGQKRWLRHRYTRLGKIKEGGQKHHREPILPASLVADMLWPRKSLCYRATYEHGENTKRMK